MYKVLGILTNRFRYFPSTGNPLDYYEEIVEEKEPVYVWEAPSFLGSKSGFFMGGCDIGLGKDISTFTLYEKPEN